MNEPEYTTAHEGTCACGAVFPGPKRGPIPALCPECKRRHRCDLGRGYYAVLRDERAAHPQPVDKTGWIQCPYCPDLMPAWRKKCGKPECNQAYQRDRCRVWQAEYKAEHGVKHGKRTEEGREKRRQEKARWNAANPESVKASWARDAVKATARRRVASAERKRQKMQLIVHPAPYSALPAKHPVMLMQVPQDRRHRRGVRLPGRFIGGTCARCGEPFIGYGGRDFKYCSDACLNMTCKDNRRAVEHVPYRRIDIYIRDAWRCHICGRKTRRDVHYNHALAPTIDHLVPVTQGGIDAPVNLACAHRYCNCIKSDTGGAQLRLVG